MAFRISPLWWPVLLGAAPVLVPLLLVRNRRFQSDRRRAASVNRERIDRAGLLELPPLKKLELTVLVEHETRPGFVGDTAVSYFLRSEHETLLFDVGYGPQRPALAHNAAKLGFSLDQADAVVISHMHVDHLGGYEAGRRRTLTIPDSLGAPQGQPCFLPDRGKATGFDTEIVTGPRMLVGGIATTGPLARSLFTLGWTEEQALIAHLEGKGLVVVTGCGHQGVGCLLDLVACLSEQPIHAICGGLHLPVGSSPEEKLGIHLQTFLGTGKPPWKKITDADLTGAIERIRAAAPRRLLLSAHDTSPHAIERLAVECGCDTEVLAAGATYEL